MARAKAFEAKGKGTLRRRLFDGKVPSMAKALPWQKSLLGQTQRLVEVKAKGTSKATAL
jgi:hypothetical protein